MKINEVEKLTGLTAKSIRHYEAKGLITVHRDEENGYRSYTEEDVTHLKRIKILRYLEFGIEDIRHMQELELSEIQTILQNQAEKFEEQSDTCDMKKLLCVSLCKDYDMQNDMVEEYDDAIDFLEGEVAELRDTIKDFTCPSTIQMIVWSLVFGAPIVVGIAAIVLINEFIILLFAPKDWLFYEFQGSGQLVLILITELPFMGALLYLIERLRHVPEQKSNDLAFIFSFFWKHKLISACVWCVLFYLAIVNVTFVTSDKIVCYSTLHPTGVTYQYEDITKVNACFGWKRFAVKEYKRKGTFSYRIYMDEKELVFSQPCANEDIKRYEDTYLELEEFDKKVMSLGVPKEGSEKYSDICDFDKRYVERFLRIVRNGS